MNNNKKTWHKDKEKPNSIKPWSSTKDMNIIRKIENARCLPQEHLDRTKLHHSHFASPNLAKAKGRGKIFSTMED